jgi:uncharacterized protein YlxW (UPF0749 family)
MPLLNIRRSGNGGLAERADSNRTHASPVIAALADLKAENQSLRSKVHALESRVGSLEGFRSDQEQFNAGTRDRVSQLTRNSAAADVPCPGCGNPMGDGPHGVTCFTTVGGS